MSNELQEEYDPEVEEEPEELAPEEEEPEEEGPGLAERAENVRDQIERGKKIYEKLNKPKGETPVAKPTSGATQGADKGLEQTAGAGAKQAGKEAGKDAAKQAGKTAAKTAVKAGAEAATAPETAGVSILAIELADRLATFAQKHKKQIKWAIAFLLFCSIAIWLVLGAFCAYLLGGGLGKTNPQPAGKENPNVKAILSEAAEPVKALGGATVSGFNKIDLNATDKQFVQDGLIDQRLAQAVVSLSNKHYYLKISHIVEGYKDMVGESGSDSNPQITANVSAHKDGLAADVAEIDFVYKVLEYKDYCQGDKDFDIVYYGDRGVETSATATPTEADSITIPSSDEVKTKIEQETTAIKQSIEDLQNILNERCANTQNQDIMVLKQKLEELATQNEEFKNKLNDTLNALQKLQNALQSIVTILQTANQSVPEAIIKLIQYLRVIIDTLESVDRSLSGMYLDLDTATSDLSDILGENCEQVTAEQLQPVLDQLNQNLMTLDSLRDLPDIKNLVDWTNLLNQIGDQIEQLIKDNLATLADVLGQIAPETETLSGLGLSGGSRELLRLYCEGDWGMVGDTNSSFRGGAKAIPIKVAWQDPKPNVQYIDTTAKNDCASHEPIAGDRVCREVFRPEAQRKVHTVIAEMLQFPYDMGDKFYWRVTQLITYSHERDVAPFSDQLNDLYGSIRAGNYGLFAMPEAWAQIHISY